VDRAASFKRFYLYSALSIAVLAASFAAAALLSRPLEYAGLALRTPSDEDLRRTISFALSVLVFAIPVGLVHHRLIRRSLGDPVEAAADVRHFFLNAWIALAILVVMGALAAIAQNALNESRDVATQSSFLSVALVVGFAAWRWREQTPAPTRKWEAVCGSVALLVAMLLAAVSLAGAVGAFARLLLDQPGGPLGPGGRLPPYSGSWADLHARDLRNAGVYTAIALATWAFVVRWQWRVPSVPLRRLYLTGAYAAGLAFLSFGAVNEIEQALTTGATLRTVSGPWPFLAIGLLLTPLHAAGLWRERRSWPAAPGYIPQLLAAVPALFGLAQLLVGLVMWWQLFAEAVLLGRPSFLGAAQRAAGYTLVGALLFGIGITALARSTRGAPRAEPRRFYLYTVICLALLATFLMGATTVYNVLVPLLGVTERGSGDRALQWSVPTLIGAVVFVTHLLVLRRDARADRPPSAIPARQVPAFAADPLDAPDPLVALLGDVRAGRVEAADAAARIRGGLVG